MNLPLTMQRATRGKTALTHRGIETLRPDIAAYRVGDARCPGLSVRVAPSGLKTWDVAYRIRGTGAFRRLSLGSFPAVALEAARTRATALTGAAQAGHDLLAEEKAARVAADARTTVGQLAELYLSRRVRGRLRTAAEMELRFKRTFASLKERYADDIHRRDLRKVLDAVVERGAPREAQQQRQLMRVLFRWAMDQDIIENDPSVGLASVGSSPRRDRVLAPAEIKALANWIATAEMPSGYADALMVQLALGARIGEVAGMHAAEVDQTTWIWTLPPDRSKNGRPRVTPLFGLAREIVARRLASVDKGALFETEHGDTLTTNCVASFLVKRRKEIPIAHFTSHDLRRTAATAIVDLGFSYETVAAVLGHETGNKDVRTLIRHYVRSDLIDRKQKALEAWDFRLRQIFTGKTPPANVTQLPVHRVDAA